MMFTASFTPLIGSSCCSSALQRVCVCAGVCVLCVCVCVCVCVRVCQCVYVYMYSAGETWIDGVDITDEQGNINWALGAYVMSFTIIVNWTLLQVSVAVLLDNFVSETAREKDAHFRLEQQAHRVKDTVVNVLDPLLCILANEYVDDHHFCIFLRKLFRVMSQGQECLDPPALCTALTALDVTPPIHFTRLDYEALTQSNSGAALEGGVDVEKFVILMRYQVRGYIERKLQRSVSEASMAEEDSEFSSLASLKTLMSDVHSVKFDVLSVKSDLKQLHEVRVREIKCQYLNPTLNPGTAP
jgi:hypothetical protein